MRSIRKFMPKNSLYVHGFTLIELLVVIAIIGVLSSVVLASLNSARGKSSDSAVKANLANSRSQAELYFDNNNYNYTTVCTTGANNVSAILLGAVRSSNDADGAVSNDAATTATVGVCNDQVAGWAAEMPLKSTNGASFWCVDNTGKSQLNSSAGLTSTSDINC